MLYVNGKLVKGSSFITLKQFEAKKFFFMKQFERPIRSLVCAVKDFNNTLIHTYLFLRITEISFLMFPCYKDHLVTLLWCNQITSHFISQLNGTFKALVCTFKKLKNFLIRIIFVWVEKCKLFCPIAASVEILHLILLIVCVILARLADSSCIWRSHDKLRESRYRVSAMFCVLDEGNSMLTVFAIFSNNWINENLYLPAVVFHSYVLPS